MKKTLLVVLLLFISFGLIGCEKEEVDEGIVFNVPDEVFISLQDLPYSEYISLLNPVVTISVKDMGDIKIQLFPQIAPNTVSSFIAYIQAGAYTDNEFHRVVNEFMIQGGQLEEPSCKIYGEMTKNGYENTLEHDRGIISMARLGDDYNSATSQFFIVHQKQNFLDTEYAGFGGVTSGFNVLDYIAMLEARATIDNTDRGIEVPLVPVYIDSITVELNGYTVITPTCIE